MQKKKIKFNLKKWLKSLGIVLPVSLISLFSTTAAVRASNNVDNTELKNWTGTLSQYEELTALYNYAVDTGNTQLENLLASVKINNFTLNDMLNNNGLLAAIMSMNSNGAAIQIPNAEIANPNTTYSYILSLSDINVQAWEQLPLSLQKFVMPLNLAKAVNVNNETQYEVACLVPVQSINSIYSMIGVFNNNNLNVVQINTGLGYVNFYVAFINLTQIYTVQNNLISSSQLNPKTNTGLSIYDTGNLLTYENSFTLNANTIGYSNTEAAVGPGSWVNLTTLNKETGNNTANYAGWVSANASPIVTQNQITQYYGFVNSSDAAETTPVTTGDNLFQAEIGSGVVFTPTAIGEMSLMAGLDPKLAWNSNIMTSSFGGYGFNYANNVTTTNDGTGVEENIFTAPAYTNSMSGNPFPVNKNQFQQQWTNAQGDYTYSNTNYGYNAGSFGDGNVFNETTTATKTGSIENAGYEYGNWLRGLSLSGTKTTNNGSLTLSNSIAGNVVPWANKDQTSIQSFNYSSPWNYTDGNSYDSITDSLSTWNSLLNFDSVTATSNISGMYTAMVQRYAGLLGSAITAFTAAVTAFKAISIAVQLGKLNQLASIALNSIYAALLGTVVTTAGELEGIINYGYKYLTEIPEYVYTSQLFNGLYNQQSTALNQNKTWPNWFINMVTGMKWLERSIVGFMTLLRVNKTIDPKDFVVTTSALSYFELFIKNPAYTRQFTDGATLYNPNLGTLTDSSGPILGGVSATPTTVSTSSLQTNTTDTLFTSSSVSNYTPVMQTILNGWDNYVTGGNIQAVSQINQALNIYTFSFLATGGNVNVVMGASYANYLSPTLTKPINYTGLNSNNSGSGEYINQNISQIAWANPLIPVDSAITDFNSYATTLNLLPFSSASSIITSLNLADTTTIFTQNKFNTTLQNAIDNSGLNNVTKQTHSVKVSKQIDLNSPTSNINYDNAQAVYQNWGWLTTNTNIDSYTLSDYNAIYTSISDIIADLKAYVPSVIGKQMTIADFETGFITYLNDSNDINKVFNNLGLSNSTITTLIDNVVAQILSQYLNKNYNNAVFSQNVNLITTNTITLTTENWDPLITSWSKYVADIISTASLSSLNLNNGDNNNSLYLALWYLLGSQLSESTINNILEKSINNTLEGTAIQDFINNSQSLSYIGKNVFTGISNATLQSLFSFLTTWLKPKIDNIQFGTANNNNNLTLQDIDTNFTDLGTILQVIYSHDNYMQSKLIDVSNTTGLTQLGNILDWITNLNSTISKYNSANKNDTTSATQLINTQINGIITQYNNLLLNLVNVLVGINSKTAPTYENITMQQTKNAVSVTIDGIDSYNATTTVNSILTNLEPALKSLGLSILQLQSVENKLTTILTNNLENANFPTSGSTSLVITITPSTSVNSMSFSNVGLTTNTGSYLTVGMYLDNTTINTNSSYGLTYAINLFSAANGLSQKTFMFNSPKSLPNVTNSRISAFNYTVDNAYNLQDIGSLSLTFGNQGVSGNAANVVDTNLNYNSQHMYLDSDNANISLWNWATFAEPNVNENSDLSNDLAPDINNITSLIELSTNLTGVTPLMASDFQYYWQNNGVGFNNSLYNGFYSWGNANFNTSGSSPYAWGWLNVPVYFTLGSNSPLIYDRYTNELTYSPTSPIYLWKNENATGGGVVPLSVSSNNNEYTTQYYQPMQGSYNANVNGWQNGVGTNKNIANWNYTTGINQTSGVAFGSLTNYNFTLTSVTKAANKAYYSSPNTYQGVTKLSENQLGFYSPLINYKNNSNSNYLQNFGANTYSNYQTLLKAVNNISSNNMAQISIPDLQIYNKFGGNATPASANDFGISYNVSGSLSSFWINTVQNDFTNQLSTPNANGNNDSVNVSSFNNWYYDNFYQFNNANIGSFTAETGESDWQTIHKPVIKGENGSVSISTNSTVPTFTLNGLHTSSVEAYNANSINNYYAYNTIFVNGVVGNSQSFYINNDFNLNLNLSSDEQSSFLSSYYGNDSENSTAAYTNFNLMYQNMISKVLQNYYLLSYNNNSDSSSKSSSDSNSGANSSNIITTNQNQTIYTTDNLTYGMELPYMTNGNIAMQLMYNSGYYKTGDLANTLSSGIVSFNNLNSKNNDYNYSTPIVLFTPQLNANIFVNGLYNLTTNDTNAYISMNNLYNAENEKYTIFNEIKSNFSNQSSILNFFLNNLYIKNEFTPFFQQLALYSIFTLLYHNRIYYSGNTINQNSNLTNMLKGSNLVFNTLPYVTPLIPSKVNALYSPIAKTADPFNESQNDPANTNVYFGDNTYIPTSVILTNSAVTPNTISLLQKGPNQLGSNSLYSFLDSIINSSTPTSSTVLFSGADIFDNLLMKGGWDTLSTWLNKITSATLNISYTTGLYWDPDKFTTSTSPYATYFEEGSGFKVLHNGSGAYNLNGTNNEDLTYTFNGKDFSNINNVITQSEGTQNYVMFNNQANGYTTYNAIYANTKNLIQNNLVSGNYLSENAVTQNTFIPTSWHPYSVLGNININSTNLFSDMSSKDWNSNVSVWSMLYGNVGTISGDIFNNLITINGQPLLNYLNDKSNNLANLGETINNVISAIAFGENNFTNFTTTITNYSALNKDTPNLINSLVENNTLSGGYLPLVVNFGKNSANWIDNYLLFNKTNEPKDNTKVWDAFIIENTNSQFDTEMNMLMKTNSANDYQRFTFNYGNLLVGEQIFLQAINAALPPLTASTYSFNSLNFYQTTQNSVVDSLNNLNTNIFNILNTFTQNYPLLTNYLVQMQMAYQPAQTMSILSNYTTNSYVYVLYQMLINNNALITTIMNLNSDNIVGAFTNSDKGGVYESKYYGLFNDYDRLTDSFLGTNIVYTTNAPDYATWQLTSLNAPIKMQSNGNFPSTAATTQPVVNISQNINNRQLTNSVSQNNNYPYEIALQSNYQNTVATAFTNLATMLNVNTNSLDFNNYYTFASNTDTNYANYDLTNTNNGFSLNNSLMSNENFSLMYHDYQFGFMNLLNSSTTPTQNTIYLFNSNVPVLVGDTWLTNNYSLNYMTNRLLALFLKSHYLSDFAEIGNLSNITNADIVNAVATDFITGFMNFMVNTSYATDNDSLNAILTTLIEANSPLGWMRLYTEPMASGNLPFDSEPNNQVLDDTTLWYPTAPYSNTNYANAGTWNNTAWNNFQPVTIAIDNTNQYAYSTDFQQATNATNEIAETFKVQSLPTYETTDSYVPTTITFANSSQLNISNWLGQTGYLYAARNLSNIMAQTVAYLSQNQNIASTFKPYFAAYKTIQVALMSQIPQLALSSVLQNSELENASVDLDSVGDITLNGANTVIENAFGLLASDLVDYAAINQNLAYDSSNDLKIQHYKTTATNPLGGDANIPEVTPYNVLNNTIPLTNSGDMSQKYLDQEVGSSTYNNLYGDLSYPETKFNTSTNGNLTNLQNYFNAISNWYSLSQVFDNFYTIPFKSMTTNLQNVGNVDFPNAVNGVNTYSINTVSQYLAGINSIYVNENSVVGSDNTTVMENAVANMLSFNNAISTPMDFINEDNWFNLGENYTDYQNGGEIQWTGSAENVGLQAWNNDITGGIATLLKPFAKTVVQNNIGATLINNSNISLYGSSWIYYLVRFPTVGLTTGTLVNIAKGAYYTYSQFAALLGQAIINFEPANNGGKTLLFNLASTKYFGNQITINTYVTNNTLINEATNEQNAMPNIIPANLQVGEKNTYSSTQFLSSTAYAISNINDTTYALVSTKNSANDSPYALNIVFNPNDMQVAVYLTINNPANLYNANIYNIGHSTKLDDILNYFTSLQTDITTKMNLPTITGFSSLNNYNGLNTPYAPLGIFSTSNNLLTNNGNASSIYFGSVLGNLTPNSFKKGDNASLDKQLSNLLNNFGDNVAVSQYNNQNGWYVITANTNSMLNQQLAQAYNATVAEANTWLGGAGNTTFVYNKDFALNNNTYDLANNNWAIVKPKDSQVGYQIIINLSDYIVNTPNVTHNINHTLTNENFNGNLLGLLGLIPLLIFLFFFILIAKKQRDDKNENSVINATDTLLVTDNEFEIMLNETKTKTKPEKVKKIKKEKPVKVKKEKVKHEKPVKVKAPKVKKVEIPDKNKHERAI